VDNERTLHISILLAIAVPKLSNLVEIWRSIDKNKLGQFLAHPVLLLLVSSYDQFTTTTPTLLSSAVELSCVVGVNCLLVNRVCRCSRQIYIYYYGCTEHSSL